MTDIHHTYVSLFRELGELQLFKVGYSIEVEVINGNDGLTSINLRKSDGDGLVVQFAYNRLDYNLGVIVYGITDGKIDSSKMILPKKISTESDTYGYMGNNLKSEIQRLINDICKLLKQGEQKPINKN